MTDKKRVWVPAHEVCIEDLTIKLVTPAKSLHWAEVYAAGAIVPAKDIPRLIQAFEAATKDVMAFAPASDNPAHIDSIVRLAIEKLQEQLKESQDNQNPVKKKKGDADLISRKAAEACAGEDWHRMSEAETMLVKVLEEGGYIIPNNPANGFVGKAAHGKD